jgi:hypothetical protein
MHISVAAGSTAALDLTFVNPVSAQLYSYREGSNRPQDIDHFSVFIEYNGVIERRKDSRTSTILHRIKDIDLSAFMEKDKRKNHGIRTHNGLHRDRDVREKYENFIQIIEENLGEITPKGIKTTLEKSGQ